MGGVGFVALLFYVMVERERMRSIYFLGRRLTIFGAGGVERENLRPLFAHIRSFFFDGNFYRVVAYLHNN